MRGGPAIQDSPGKHRAATIALADPVNGCGDAAVALRLLVRTLIGEEAQLLRIGGVPEAGESDSQEPGRHSTLLPELAEELPGNGIHRRVRLYALGYRATVLPRREVAVPELHRDVRSDDTLFLASRGSTSVSSSPRTFLCSQAPLRLPNHS